MNLLTNNFGINSNIACKIIILFLVIVFVGCGSTKPIILTYTEYVPPIREGEIECLGKIADNLRICQERVRLETKECQELAFVEAQGRYDKAKIDHQMRIAEMEKQRQQRIEDRELKIIALKNEYKDCQDRKRQIEAEQYAKQVAGGSSVPNPNPQVSFVYIPDCSYIEQNLNNLINSNRYDAPIQNVFNAKLEDFVEDAHCFEDNEFDNKECIDEYNELYVKCGGNVMKTHRCFTNCKGDN